MLIFCDIKLVTAPSVRVTAAMATEVTTRAMTLLIIKIQRKTMRKLKDKFDGRFKLNFLEKLSFKVTNWNS